MNDFSGGISISGFNTSFSTTPKPPETEEEVRVASGHVTNGHRMTCEDALPDPWQHGRGLPTYYKSECPLCPTNLPPRTCQKCRKSLNTIPDPAVCGHGYMAQTYTHFHFKSMDDKFMLREAAILTLCLECYREDFVHAYPGSQPPV